MGIDGLLVLPGLVWPGGAGGLSRSMCWACSSALNYESMIDKCGQALKGAWWMSWHREATKDVEACDKLREAGNQALIRRFLNAETRPRQPRGHLPLNA